MKEVAVLSFDFKGGDKRSPAQAMIWLTPEEISKPDITYTDLTSEEIESLVQIARAVELRLLTGTPASSEEELSRTQRMQFAYELLSKKYGNLYQLELQVANYGAGQAPLELQNQLTVEKVAIAELEEQLRGL